MPEAIRRNLPARLSHLIRRKRGRRAGSHCHRPISVVCGTRAAGGRLDTVSRDPTADAGARARYLTYPQRLTAGQTLKLQGSERSPAAAPAVVSDTPSRPGPPAALPIPTTESYRPDTYRRSQTTTRECLLIDVATDKQCRPRLAAQMNGTRERTAVTSRPLLTLELLNIQSLMPKMPDILADVTSTCPDILCYTETNLKVATPDRFVTIPGYTNHRSDRITGRKKSGGGVSIYVKASFDTDAPTASSENVYVPSCKAV